MTKAHPSSFPSKSADTLKPESSEHKRILNSRSREKLWLSVLSRTVELDKVGKHPVHKNVPKELLNELTSTYIHLSKADILKAIGGNSRTLQKVKSEFLNSKLSIAMFDLIEVTQMAADVLGGRMLAEKWLQQPVLALDGRRPIDMLSTRQGVNMIKEHLFRIDHGVYA